MRGTREHLCKSDKRPGSPFRQIQYNSVTSSCKDQSTLTQKPSAASRNLLSSAKWDVIYKWELPSWTSLQMRSGG